jgi:hypothetical protein
VTYDYGEIRNAIKPQKDDREASDGVGTNQLFGCSSDSFSRLAYRFQQSSGKTANAYTDTIGDSDSIRYTEPNGDS